jgi:hypothetical protein
VPGGPSATTSDFGPENECRRIDWKFGATVQRGHGENARFMHAQCSTIPTCLRGDGSLMRMLAVVLMMGALGQVCTSNEKPAQSAIEAR